MPESVHDKRSGPGRWWTGLVLGTALVVMALVAGLNFTFAAAVMPNLAGVDDRTFVVIMQGFNENPVFPVSFTAALLLTILAIVVQVRLAPGPAVRWVVSALVLYGLVLAITGGVHLPINEQISQAGDPDRIADLADLRNQVEARWVTWNVVRTLVCVAAASALARAVFLQGRRHTNAIRTSTR